MLSSASTTKRSRRSGASASPSAPTPSALPSADHSHTASPPSSPVHALPSEKADDAYTPTTQPRRSARSARTASATPSPSQSASAHSPAPAALDEDTDTDEDSEMTPEPASEDVQQPHRSVIHCGVAAEPHEESEDGFVRTRFLPYFNETVDVFFASGDKAQQLLVRCSSLANKLNCKTNKLAMWLSRRAGRKDFEGIFQATGFENKPLGRCGLKSSSYFLTLDACRQFELFRGTGSGKPSRPAQPASRKKAARRPRPASEDEDEEEEADEEEYLPAAKKRARSRPAAVGSKRKSSRAAAPSPRAESPPPAKRQKGPAVRNSPARADPTPLAKAVKAEPAVESDASSALNQETRSPKSAPRSPPPPAPEPDPKPVTRSTSTAPAVEMLMQLRAGPRLSPPRAPVAPAASAPPPSLTALDFGSKVLSLRPPSPDSCSSSSVLSARSLAELSVKSLSPAAKAASPLFAPLTPSAVRPILSPAHSVHSVHSGYSSATSIPASPYTASAPFRFPSPSPSPLFTGMGAGWSLPLSQPFSLGFPGHISNRPLMVPMWPQQPLFFPPGPLSPSLALQAHQWGAIGSQPTRR